MERCTVGWERLRGILGHLPARRARHAALGILALFPYQHHHGETNQHYLDDTRDTRLGRGLSADGWLIFYSAGWFGRYWRGRSDRTCRARRRRRVGWCRYLLRGGVRRGCVRSWDGRCPRGRRRRCRRGGCRRCGRVRCPRGGWGRSRSGKVFDPCIGIRIGVELNQGGMSVIPARFVGPEIFGELEIIESETPPERCLRLLRREGRHLLHVQAQGRKIASPGRGRRLHDTL